MKKLTIDPLKIAIFGVIGLAIFFIVMIVAFDRDWEDEVTNLSDEETYFVYLYTDTCERCQKLVPEIQFFIQQQPMDIPLIPEDSETSSINFPSEQSIVPRVFVVHQGEIVRIEAGLTNVRNLLQEGLTGVFQP